MILDEEKCRKTSQKYQSDAAFEVEFQKKVIVIKCNLSGQVRPSFLKESFHVPSTLSYRRIILVKDLTVLKDKTDVILKLVSAFVSATVIIIIMYHRLLILVRNLHSVIEFLPDG